MTVAARRGRVGSGVGAIGRGLLVGLALPVGFVAPAWPQGASPLQQESRVDPEAKLLLEADELVYDFDREVVSAVGGVQIYYGAYVLDAATVTYDQRSGRLVASGGVRILEPSGNVINAETVDITDDFRDGFVASLNVLTIDRARFAAQSGERRDGNLLILRKGVYTACEPCADNPGRPPLWQIKAERIVHDQAERTVYYENASLEFLGVPIAYTPIFFHADPTVRRKTGFLTPRIRETEALGIGVTTPFFWNLAPNYDLTFAPTPLTRQGLLMETEWRHRLLTGSYSIRAAGILQQDRGAFAGLSGDREFRGSVRTIGDFAINSRWTTGWDLTATTDRTFNRDYRISGATAKDLPSTVYLTGLSDTNFFDARGYYFRVQREDTVDFGPDRIPGTGDDYEHDDQAEQAVVHPVIDHNYLWDDPVLGGELRLDSNVTSVSRQETDQRLIDLNGELVTDYSGVAGTYSRATSKAEWQRKILAPGGQVLTPFSYVQADVNWAEPDDTVPGLDHDVLARAMPAVGIDYEWPFLATAGSSVHTFGPKAQLIARPNEQFIGDLPNEDAQSLVFDDTTLFARDKFSGYDRQEGGTRANLGIVYQGLFASGASVDALFGQSVHLAGRNSFEEDDHALTGVDSGLDERTSDYVGRVTVNSGTGVAVTARARIDDEDLVVNRGELNAIAAAGRNVASVGYAYLRESPGAGVFEDRQEISAGAVVALNKFWAVSGAIVYDLENSSTVRQSIGLAYDDECLNLSATYSDTRDQYSDLVTGREVFVRINLRTLGSGELTSQLGD